MLELWVYAWEHNRWVSWTFFVNLHECKSVESTHHRPDPSLSFITSSLFLTFYLFNLQPQTTDKVRTPQPVHWFFLLLKCTRGRGLFFFLPPPLNVDTSLFISHFQYSYVILGLSLCTVFLHFNYFVLIDWKQHQQPTAIMNLVGKVLQMYQLWATPPVEVNFALVVYCNSY